MPPKKSLRHKRTIQLKRLFALWGDGGGLEPKCAELCICFISCLVRELAERSAFDLRHPVPPVQEVLTVGLLFKGFA